MKSVRNHLMFILPLLAILLGIEFYQVFERVTKHYEEKLKTGYTMLVVAKKPITLATLKQQNEHIASLTPIKREQIVKEAAGNLDKQTQKEILSALPYFYNAGLDSYLGIQMLEKIKIDLEKLPEINRVETFGSSYSSVYRLFTFIRFLLKFFIGFMGIVSLLLIMKQMEIWRYEHQERMQIMEIFGAPLMLRSGVLFRIAFVDAVMATMITAGIFLYVKLSWVPQSNIPLLMQKQNVLFVISDIWVLLGVALGIVFVAVFSVVLSSTKGIKE